MVHRGPGISENQLLKLIQNPKEELAKEIGRRAWQSFFSLSALKARASFLLENLKHVGKKDRLDLKGILRSCIVVLLVVFVVNIVTGWRSVYHIPPLSANKKAAADLTGEVAASKSISEYLEPARRRDLFKFGSAETSEEVSVPTEAPAAGDEGPLVNLALVGISFSEDPDVMIKDNTTQEVYFLKRGDHIGKKIRIEAILKDRVIVSYQGKEMELK